MLTLRGRYDLKRRSAVFWGRLTAGGKPRAGVEMRVEAVSPEGVHDCPVLTDTSGAYSLQTRISHTTLFRVHVEGAIEPCEEPSSAPAGCLGTTVPGLEGRPVVVRVPRKPAKR